MPKTVLILGNPRDQHAAHMQGLLTELGARAEFLDFGEFPQSLKIAFDPANRAGRFTLPTGAIVPFSEVESVYWRNYNTVALKSRFHLPDPEQAFIAENDSRSLAESILDALPCRWVNGLAGYLEHQRKPSALAKVAALGARVPATIVTNEIGAIAEFQARHAHCIFKPVQGGAHTRRLTREKIDAANWAALSLCPVTVQEEIQGTNIRAFVIGDEVLACEVQTDMIDFRDDQTPTIRAATLPEATQREAVQIARALSLKWTGIDYRLSTSGEYYFLEANPSPMFIGFEARSGLPLGATLARYLLG